MYFVHAFESILQRIRLSLKSASTHASDCRGAKGQRHDSVLVAVVVLDTCKVSKEMTSPLLGLIVLLVRERCIRDCDHSYFIPFDMSSQETEFHLVTFVCQLDHSICIS